MKKVLVKNKSQIVRKNILSRLREISIDHVDSSLIDSYYPRKSFTKEVKVKKFKKTIEAAHAEVYLCTENDWCNILTSIVKEKKIKKLLYGRKTVLGKKLFHTFEHNSINFTELVDYNKPIEECKDLLFDIDSSITSTIGGIAETGSLILWPSSDEPRLMSLIPPIHIAVLYENTIHSNFFEAMSNDNWINKMPTNALLISGPSKTADIEQTLVYGVHGCKELVVLLIK